MGNTIGKLFRLTTFGESHGAAVGGVIDGIPAGITIDFNNLRQRMDERRPGKNVLTSPREETDETEILSGIFEGKTLGTPIGFIIRNRDQRPDDYGEMRGSYRPGHADYAYICKYGIADHRGGGRASARTTAPIVFCGAMAAQILAGSGIHVTAELVQAGHSVSGGEPEDEISACKSCGDSCGGTVKCEITGMPSGLGEPLFDKFQATLAQAIMGINAVKGFEYGQGFRSAYLRGSECLDSYSTSESGLHEVRNINGGTSGGITTGEKFLFSVAFKPTPTFPGNKYLYEKSGNVKERIRIGRHDPCVALRGKYIVRAMTEIITLDFLLQRKAYIPFQHESMV